MWLREIAIETRSFTALFDELGDQAGPAGLVAGADSGAVIPVKVFIKENQIAPVRVGLKYFLSASDRAAAVVIAQKNVSQPAGDFCRDLPEIGLGLRMRWAFHFEVLAVVVMKLLQRFDEEIVHREPDRAAPIRIATEQTCGGFRGFVFDTAHVAVDLNFVRMIQVIARKSADAI